MFKPIYSINIVRAPGNILKQGVADAPLAANSVFLQNPVVFFFTPSFYLLCIAELSFTVSIRQKHLLKYQTSLESVNPLA